MEPLPSKQFFDEDVFGLVRDQHQFPSRRINFTPRTSFVRPKTFCCQQQSSQYPIFPSQTRDQSFIRVAKWDETREDVADFADRETCSFVRLNDAFRKALLKATTKSSKNAHKESRVQWKTRADFKLAYTENYKGSYDRRFLSGGGGEVVG